MQRRADRAAPNLSRASAREIRARVLGLAPLAQLAVLTVVVCELASPVQAFAVVGHNMDVIWEVHPPLNCNRMWGYTLTSGDFNGDGYSDVVFTYDSMFWRDTLSGADSVDHKARIYFGGPSGPESAPGLVFSRPAATGDGLCFGLGDVNGDGFDDLALTYSDNYNHDYLYFGGNPMDTVCDVEIYEPNRANSGFPVAHSDLNGDGIQDIAVGGAFDNNPHGGGRVFIYYGSRQMVYHPHVDVVLNSPGGDKISFGGHIGGGGDLNGDGYEDLVVGCYAGDPSCIYAYLGGRTIDTIPAAIGVADEPSGIGGWGTDILRRDGDYDWVAAGDCDHGRVYLFSGGSPLDWNHPTLKIERNEPYIGFGRSTARAGRVDGGRYDGFISGAADVGGSLGPGYAYLWNGRRGFDTIPDGWVTGTLGGQAIGFVNASAGDVDGDGRDEVILGNYVSMRYETLGVWVCKYTGPQAVKENRSECVARTTVQIRPSPSSGPVSLSLTAPAHGPVTFQVFDLAGKRIRSLTAGNATGTGSVSVVWNLLSDRGDQVSSGVYVVRASAVSQHIEATGRVLVRRTFAP